MTRVEQLKFCTKCTHRQMDMKQGMLCELTNAKADFDEKCENFNVDQKALEKEMMIEREKSAERMPFEPQNNTQENHKMKGIGWFATIGCLSLLNIVLAYVGVRMIFGLGITMILSDLFGPIGIALAIVISLIYILLYVFASKKELEWAYRLGMYAYLADAIILLTLLFADSSFLVDNIFHWGLIIILLATHPIFLSKKIRDKAKSEKWTVGRIVTSIIVGILIAASITFSAIGIKGQDSSSSDVNAMVIESNKSLPMNIDDETIWEKVYLDGKACVFQYKLPHEDITNYDSEEIVMAEKMMKLYFLSNQEDYKSDPSIIPLSQQHYSLRYEYKDKNNQILYTVELSAEELAAMIK